MTTFLRLPSRWLTGALAVFALTHCTLRDPVQEAPTGPGLQFRLVRIEQATLGSLDVYSFREPQDVGLDARSQLIREYVSGSLPLHMRLVLDARDASLQGATLNGLDYEVQLDGKPLGGGRLPSSAVLPSGGEPVVLPFEFTLETHKLLGNDALPALRNFAVGLADRRRRPLRLGLRLRPSTQTADGHTRRAESFTVVQSDSVK